MDILIGNRRFLRSVSIALTCAACAIFATVCTLGSVAAQKQDTQKKDLLPEAPGKALVAQKCTQCHDAARFALQRHTEDEWDQVITQMQSNGMSLTDEEYDIVLNYLSKNLAPSSAPRNDGHD
jgi:Fe-S-cluster-containing hydrogenase component 2